MVETAGQAHRDSMPLISQDGAMKNPLPFFTEYLADCMCHKVY